MRSTGRACEYCLAKMTEEGRVIAEGGRGGWGWPGEVRYVPAAGEVAR